VDERYETALAESERVLDDVDRALARLSDGTYASCEVCGTTLSDADFEDAPTRRTCALHLPL
jgi:RNA polymerase-binding transcription factor DksA